MTPKGRLGLILLFLLIAGAGFLPPQLAAQSAGSTPEIKPWFRTVTLNGFVSGSYTHNFNHPDSQLNQLRVFDFHADKLVFDVGEFVIQKPVSKSKEWGFRMDLTAGSDEPEVSASYGLFRDEDGEAGDVDIHQLYVSYMAPVGSGLRIDFGKFVTHMGYEVIDGYDGYNDNASRSFLFGYGIPFTQTGLKTSHSFNSKVSASLMLVEGADVVKDNNSSKSVGAQLTFNPSKSVTLIANYMGGAERKNDNHDLRHTWELIGTWKLRENIALSLDTLYGTDANAVGPGHDGDWVALASYLRYDFTSRWAIAARGEVFNDKGGVRTGTQQELTSFVLTPQYKRAISLGHFKSTYVIRGDLRFDHSSREVFQHFSEYQKRQVTTSINLIYLF
jgi:Putative beta-barrel porin-2, OmpL-like. bbp2